MGQFSVEKPVAPGSALSGNQHCAGFFCLAAALGGGAQAAQVYPGCAQPGPTGKVWWVDPVNGKIPAAGGNGTEARRWNSLQGLSSDQAPARLHASAAVERPLPPRRRRQARLTLRTSSGARQSSPATRSS